MKTFLAALFFLLAAPSAHAAIARQSVGAGADASTPISWTETVPATSNMEVVWIQQNSVGSNVTVTAGGVSMTQPVARVNVGSNVWQYIYYLMNPPTGTITIAATLVGGTGEIDGISASYSGVDTSSIDGNTSGTGTGTSFSSTITPTVSNDWYFASMGHFAAATFTGGADVSSGVFNYTLDSNGGASSAGVAYSITGTQTSAAWGYVGFAVRPSVPAVVKSVRSLLGVIWWF